VATAETSPASAAAGGSIVLETHRGARAIPVTLHYRAVRELRELAGKPDSQFSGLLRGRWSPGGIVLEHAIDAASDRDAVGIFRLQPGGWTALTLADRKKLNTVGLSRGVVLVVRTLAQRPWSATLFTVEPDIPEEDAPLAEFPWDEYLLQNGWLVDLAPPDPRLVAPAGKPSRSRLLMSAVAMVLSGAAGAAAAYQWLPALRHPPAVEAPADSPLPAPPALGLNVVRQAQDLKVLWDRDSEAVRLATAGTLTIRRGLATRVIEMRPEQLREGLVVFQPLPGVDADVRLVVVESGGKSVAESAQVLGGDALPPAPLPPPPRVLPKETAPPREAPPKPLVAKAKELAPPDGVRKPAAIAPTPARDGAVPIRRATPPLTPEIIREMGAAREKVMVSVLISIDAEGNAENAKVVAASGEPGDGAPSIRLASLAAARQWRFRPARANGKPISSEMSVLFTF
jgi:hypothetical protein